MLSLVLEDWLTDVGDGIVRKLAAGNGKLSSAERLVYELWLLDTEARNGGLSQYFANHDLQQWQSCIAVCAGASLQSFVPFAEAVSDIIAGAADSYDAINASERAGDDLWYAHKAQVVGELHAICKNAL